MKEIKRKQRQEKLAKLFYEMGMDLNLVSKISGVNIKQLNQKKEKEKE